MYITAKCHAFIAAKWEHQGLLGSGVEKVRPGAALGRYFGIQRPYSHHKYH